MAMRQSEMAAGLLIIVASAVAAMSLRHNGRLEGAEAAETAALEGLRSSAAGGESLPMVLDDSFREIAREDRPALLELLVERSREQQIIFLTDDEDIATWARLESLAGDMAIVEPVATNSNRKAGIAS